MARISHSDPAERMPPVDSGKTLSPADIALLARWIDEGASWKKHWSLTTPVRPEIPGVRHQAQVRNPVDAFVLARLEAEGLEPAPEADRVTLIRRLSYDLTGLPPTPAEVEAFVADAAPDAYEKLVDRLLASPRYGEHMARYWLDAVRYGDTHGLHFDNERALWKYRDWTIAAFAGNKPFDQFTIEQMAGDLLPGATLEQRIATGYNRCNLSTSEGGSIDDEVLARYAVDRVEAMSTVWLGLTTGCAVCHDHKFDPISQKEFYELFAFFSGAADGAMDGNALAPPPILKLPTAEQESRKAQLTAQLAETQQTLAAELANVEYHEPAAQPAAEPLERREFVWIEDALPSGAKPSSDAGGWQFVAAPSPVHSGSKSSARTSQGLSQHYFTEAKPGLRVGEGDVLFAYVYLDPLNPPKEVMLQFNDGSWEHRAVWGDDIIPWGSPNSPSRVLAGALPEVGKWVRLEIPAATVGLAPGATLGGWAFTQHDGTVWWDTAGIVTRTPQDQQDWTSQLAWEAYERGQAKSALPGPVLEAVKLEPAKRNEGQQKLVREHFLQNVYAPTRQRFAPLQTRIAEATKGLADIEGQVPSTMVMADMPQPRDTFVLIRGAYDKKGEKVTPGVPAAIAPFPADAPRNRLGLARWLVDPANPLTARVTVNRFWQQYFGTGIVKTAQDFGAQGAWPTHPELLDYLATEFIGTGWDVKRLQRLIVTSHTYRQSSRSTPEMRQRDVANELLARGPRFRLDAEVIRDSALAAGGLLVEQIGGPSVRPYQPDGLWPAVAFVGSNTSDYKPDEGSGLYRRSLYTFWKRTSPPPSLVTFDAPSRETCTVRRLRTNTPLQALVLMNDVQYVEAARRLAERAMTEAGPAPADRAALAFRLCTARLPVADELIVLVGVYEKQLAGFQADVEAANKLLAVGRSKRNESLPAPELAAWTMTANLILNLDETVTKE